MRRPLAWPTLSPEPFPSSPFQPTEWLSFRGNVGLDYIDRGETQRPDYFLDWAFEQSKTLIEASAQTTNNFVVRTTIDTTPAAGRKMM